ncbi:hypothetical protein NGM99_11905 [Mesorhizobium sp. RP14(2022)]|uniref:DUF6894 domain-containing protein n=1 Tax=Mesorhizobium liriopis TaxID=2953882 RepID=A0ABT1C6N7_9HYPH|nr:hypothetical protein [Mesorhizobium liriopis]MCO6050484.1 hypothetical protein [Mesorhizobium liriopis]
MPQYFFDTLENGRHVQGDVGLPCSSDADARLEAMKALPSIARDRIPSKDDWQAFTIQVRDKGGRGVYSATLTFAGQWLDGNESGTEGAPR